MPTRKAKTNKPPAIRILLTDDHPLFRRGVRSLLETEPDLLVCGEAATREEGLDAIVSVQPDLVITDLWLRESDGLELIKDMKQRFRRLPVLVLSMHAESMYAERVLRAGARGYVAKHEPDERFLRGVRRVPLPSPRPEQTGACHPQPD
jgi:DNA-binding NarL/FixJ family response regulator